jgi:competence protein ComEA
MHVLGSSPSRRDRWRLTIAAQPRRTWVVALVGIVVCAVAGWWLLKAPPTPVEASLPRLGTAGSTIPGRAAPTTMAASATPKSTAPSVITVHVAGAVAHPGVYQLSPNSRVADGVRAAGGAARDASLDDVNLAAPLVDGGYVRIPKVGEQPAGVVQPAGPAGGTPAAGAAVLPAGPLDLNSATVEQLDALPGVGPTMAAAIVAFRTQRGRFRSVDELDEVAGIGPTRLERLRPLVVVQ